MFRPFRFRPFRHPRTASSWAILALLLAWPAVADTVSKERLTIELNKFDDINGACRVSFVIGNHMAVDVEEVTFELVLFDKAQAVTRLLGLSAGRLPAGRTRVKQFDINNLTCGNVGRVLLNDVGRCKGDGLTAVKCLDRTAPSSRLDVPFIN